VPTKPETPTQVIASARTTVEHWRQAYEMRNFDALAKLYQHDIDLVVVHDGQPLVGWSSVEGMLKDRIARYKEIHVRLKDIQVAQLGPESATATAAMTRELGDGTTTVNEVGALTFVLHKTGEDWLVVVEHYSYKRSR
jgi:uncharacterized protein (TIGR02246 family)